MTRILVAVWVIALSLIGCGSASGDEGGPVPDSVTFNGAVVTDPPGQGLPVGAVLTVTLEDVSLADAPAVTLAQTEIPLTGQQPPVPFSLVYPGAAVQPPAIYSARARVTLGDRLLFTTTESYRVDALSPAPAELRLQAVPPPVAPPTPDVSLTETYWKLIEVDGTPVQVSDDTREPHLVLHNQDSRLAGSGGVNRLMGGFTLDGGTLTFGNIASTMMAGPPEAMQQEQAILGALGRGRGFRIAGDRLALVDDAGRPVLQAVAVALN